MKNKLETAQDLIHFLEKPEFDNLKPVLAKYGINKLDPIKIQALINQLAFDLCKQVLTETKKEGK